MRYSITKGITLSICKLFKKDIFRWKTMIFLTTNFFLRIIVLSSRIYSSVWMYSEVREVILSTVNNGPKIFPFFLIETENYNQSVVKSTTCYNLSQVQRIVLWFEIGNIFKIKSWFTIFWGTPSSRKVQDIVGGKKMKTLLFFKTETVSP